VKEGIKMEGKKEKNMKERKEEKRSI